MPDELPIDWTTGPLAEGAACFARSEYFEAHEHWEDAWRASLGLERHLLQACVQVAVALCHWQRGNLRGASGLFRKSLTHLEPCPAEFAGAQVAQLREAICAWLAFLVAPEQQSRPAIPRIPA